MIRYTGVELFMEKLKKMIYSDDNPLITNHPSILSERPRFKLIYEELDSMIQTLHSIDDQEHSDDLQEVRDLKKRFKEAAEDAHDIIDLFVYYINRGNRKSLNQLSVQRNESSGWLSMFVNKEKIYLEDVMRSMDCIKKELLTIHDNFTSDDIKKTPLSTTATGSSKRPLGTKKAYEQDIVVGFDRHAEVIRDKLTEDQKQLDVVSIVGMGGLGKTTLATKVFNDPFVTYHFHIRGWVIVSQTYQKQELLIQILESMGNKIGNVRNLDYPKLRETLHKTLMGQRYLIVIDDIWSPEAWDDVKLFFPNDYTQSRILITSRFKEVALHAKSLGFIHQLEYLTKEESWELLCKKVFHGDTCPAELIETGMQIANNCHGLPLAVVVIAGVLGKEALSRDSWRRIARRVSSYIVNDQSAYIETLAMSFDHLPGHLRDCFLYLGSFPENYKFSIRQLIWLWMAEGFIHEDGIHDPEEIAEDHVMELVDRYLVVVAFRNSIGKIKMFYVHDLLRELCFNIATKENFWLNTQHTAHSNDAYKQRRVFGKHNRSIKNAPRVRSRLFHYEFICTRKLIKLSRFWMLLMVLDLRFVELEYFPEEISRLVHLRYLAISLDYKQEFPSSVCNLWSLQTLILSRYGGPSFVLPKTISNLVNLRHLKCKGDSYVEFQSIHSIQKPMNLHTISGVKLGDGAQIFGKCFPNIKKLSCNNTTYENDFRSLTFLENLKLIRTRSYFTQQIYNRFPTSLKQLTLIWCRFDWNDMSIIQSLPNLEVLRLLRDSFTGPRWDAGEKPFRQLKVLRMAFLPIKEWEASEINFPCLKQLIVNDCHELHEIPSDFGYIPTLELISVFCCNDSVVTSLKAMQKEQDDQGNSMLTISIES